MGAMKKYLPVVLMLVVCGSVFGAIAATSNSTWIGRAPASAARKSPGVEAAQTLSMITGVAISPLLGVGAVGAWEYFSAPKEKRAHLSWYAQPFFWVPALLLVALVAAKDIVGTAAPTALKKPFDVAETIENKLSGLIAAGAFVPLIISVFPNSAGAEAWLGPGLGGSFLGMVNAGAIGNALFVPLAIVIFGLVWLVSHAINILILISPFTTVDIALKSFRVFLLSLLTATSFLHPYAGAALSLVIIVVAYCLAGWSFRLMAFGHVYAWDLLTLRRLRFSPAPNGNWAFTAAEIDGVPIRTYGKLMRSEQGELSLVFRPWLVLPQRSLPLPKEGLVVGRGLIYPEILRLEPKSALAHYGRASFLSQSGQWAKSSAAYAKALEVEEPIDLRTWLMCAGSFLRVGETEKPLCVLDP